MNELWKEHGQKIMGTLTVMLGFALTGIAAGQLDTELGSHKNLMLFVLGMFFTALGGGTVVKANGVTAQVKVAEAMSEALRATPGEPLPPAVANFVETKPEPDTADLIHEALKEDQQP
jgi:hypothetical protein